LEKRAIFEVQFCNIFVTHFWEIALNILPRSKGDIYIWCLQPYVQPCYLLKQVLRCLICIAKLCGFGRVDLSSGCADEGVNCACISCAAVLL